ncbi:MAG: DUF4349 domain-containing protein [Tissierellia bacterium]|nr:DUF4349 domain-containing protein [Tissierellia bacterium]
MKKILISLMLLLLLVGCGSKKSADSSESSGEGSRPGTEDAFPYEEQSQENSEEKINPEAVKNPIKLIITYEYNLESKDVKKSVTALEKFVTEKGGYIEEEERHLSSEKGQIRNYYATVRFPKNNNTLEHFLNNNELFLISALHKHSEDVSKEYFDLETRQKVLENRLRDLQDLQSNQKDINALLEIQKHIHETVESLEMLKGNLRFLDNKIDYDTYRISIEAGMAEKATGNVGSFSYRISEAWTATWINFNFFLQGLLLLFIRWLPYLLVLVAMIFVHRIYRKKHPRIPKSNPRIKFPFKKKSEELKDKKE